MPRPGQSFTASVDVDIVHVVRIFLSESLLLVVQTVLFDFLQLELLLL